MRFLHHDINVIKGKCFGERSIDDLARDVEPFVSGKNDLLRVKLFSEILRSWAGTE